MANIISLTAASDSDANTFVAHTGCAAGTDALVTAIDQNIGAIATATQEQSVGLREITKAVNDLDRMTQEDAAMSKRSIEIGALLEHGAEALGKMVTLFKLNRRAVQRDGSSTPAG